MLSPEDSSEPGRYSTSRAPYQRDILDAISDPDTESVTLMTSAQVGKTLIAKAMLGYIVDQDPGPVLMVQPTAEMAESFSKDRLAPMVRDTPALRGKIADARSRDSGNTILHKRFPGGHITLVGANAPAGLASRPIRWLIADEVDRYPPSAGTEGDPLNLAIARQKTFWNRRRLEMSTPGNRKTSRILRAFEAGSQEHFEVPCPHCGHRQRLVWAQVKWPEGEPELAHYECAACCEAWSDGQRIEALSFGTWVAKHPERKRRRSFHLNELYSPFRLVAQIAEEFLAAKGDPETLKTWTNTSLGEPWNDSDGERRQPELLLDRAEDYDCSDGQAVPNGVVWIDVGVDTQDDRLELEFVGWGPGEESWSLDYVVLPGSTDGPEVWDQLGEQLERVFVRADGARLPVSLMMIDSGGHATDRVYKFCAKHRRAQACVGRADAAGKGGARVPYTRPAKVSKAKSGRMRPAVIGVDGLKRTLLQGRLLLEEPGPRYCHFPSVYPLKFFEQLTSEEAITRYKAGVPYIVWDAGRRRNEALDCRILAMAGVHRDKPNLDALAARWAELAAARRGGSAVNKPPKRVLRTARSSYLGR